MSSPETCWSRRYTSRSGDSSVSNRHARLGMSCESELTLCHRLESRVDLLLRRIVLIRYYVKACSAFPWFGGHVEQYGHDRPTRRYAEATLPGVDDSLSPEAQDSGGVGWTPARFVSWGADPERRPRRRIAGGEAV